MTQASDGAATVADRSGARARAQVLGRFEVAVSGRPLTRADWRHASAERLVKLLLVTPGHRLTREVAAETLWPGGRPDRTRSNLRKAIHFARRALGTDGPLVADRRSVGLDPRRTDVDLDRLEVAADAVTQEVTSNPASPDQALGPAATDVLRLGTLEVLPDDPYEDWLAGPRERIRSRWAHIALEAARLAHRLGRREEAHDVVDRLLARDPADEAAHRLAIELYAAEGRHDAMWQQFERCRAALLDIDAEPSPETHALFARAVAGRACRRPSEPGPASRGAGHGLSQERSRNGAMRS